MEEGKDQKKQPTASSVKYRRGPSIRFKQGNITPQLNDLIKQKIEKTLKRPDIEVIRRATLVPDLDSIYSDLFAYKFTKFTEFLETFNSFVENGMKSDNQAVQIVVEDIKKKFDKHLKLWNFIAEGNLRTPAMEILQNMKLLLNISPEEIKSEKAAILKLKSEIEQLQTEQLEQEKKQEDLDSPNFNYPIDNS